VDVVVRLTLVIETAWQPVAHPVPTQRAIKIQRFAFLRMTPRFLSGEISGHFALEILHQSPKKP